MGDSYHPYRRSSDEQHQRSSDEQYRGREYRDYDSSSYQGYGHHQKYSRSRSPPRRLSYDDGSQDDDDFKFKGMSQTQAYGNSRDVNESDIYRYKQPGAYRNPRPPPLPQREPDWRDPQYGRSPGAMDPRSQRDYDVGLAMSTGDEEDYAPKKKTDKGLRLLDDQSDSHSKKRKAPGLVAPAYLGYYAKKQQELREGEQAITPQSQPYRQSGTGANAINVKTRPTTADNTQNEQSFCHQGEKLIACYLCNTSFQQLEGITRHLEKSAAHATNAKDEVKRAQGLQRLKDKGLDPTAMIPLPKQEVPAIAADTAPAHHYRDRAKERRQEENKTSGPQKIGFSLKNAAKGAKARPTSSASASDSETATGKKPTYGKGMGLLQKAGWSEGQGLGAAGAQGRADVIDQTLYSSGVGLGHESSKQGDAGEAADRATKGEGYAERGRDVMYGRFKQM